MNPSEDKINDNLHTHHNCRSKRKELLNSLELVDIWRIKHSNTLKFTWHSNTIPHIHCRLNNYLISESLLKYVKSTNIKPGYKTDHCLVDLTIDNMSMERGPGIFKMNSSILLDNAYQTKVNEYKRNNTYKQRK